MTTTNKYERKISFVDADNKRFNLEIEIRDEKKWDVLSICSQSGQWKFNPQGEYQQELLDIWNEYHLNDMQSGSPLQKKILEAEWISDYDTALKALALYNNKGEKFLSYNYIIQAEEAEKQYLILKNLKSFFSYSIEKWYETFVKGHYTKEITNDVLNNIFKDKTICITHKLYKIIKHFEVKRNIVTYKPITKDYLLSVKSANTRFLEECIKHISNLLEEFDINKLSLKYDYYGNELRQYGWAWWYKDLPTDIIDTLNTLCNEIQDDMSEQQKVSDLEYEEFIKIFPNSFCEPEKVYALACHAEATLNSVQDDIVHIEWNGNMFYMEWQDYLVCTEDEANEEFLNSVTSYVDDVWVDHIKFDTSIDIVDWDVVVSKTIKFEASTRWEFLNHYDGYEYEYSVNGVDYYIYLI